MPKPNYLAVVCHPDDLDRLRSTVPDTAGLPAITSRLVAHNTFVLHTDLEAIVAMVNDLLLAAEEVLR